MPLQKIVFQGGMDSDSSPEMMKPIEGRYRRDVRVINSENGQDQSAETIKGNTLVTFSLPSGNNTVIGSKEDKKTKKIYYFVYNDADNHSILEYDEVTSAVTTVFQDAILNFSLVHLITGINIVELEATKHLLYWTDFYNVPRKLNIEKAKYYSAGDYVNGYKFPFDPSILPRVKTPPIFAPTYIWDTDSTQDINHLFKRLFQFKVQFVFDDYEVSAWSPITDYVMPETFLSTPPLTNTGEDFATQNNRITLTVPTGSSIVTKIRVSARELSSTNDSVNPFDFSLIAELDKAILQIADDTNYNFYFYNEGNYVTLEVNESDKLFDNVPQLSQSQELISDNRLCDGLIQEGFNPVEIDMRMPMDFTQIWDFYTNTFFPKRSYLKSGGIYKHGIVYYNFANQSGTANITQGKTTELNVNGRYGTTLYIPFLTDSQYAVPNPSADNNNQYVPTVNWEIYSAPPSWATHYQIVRSKNEAMTRYIQFTSNNVRYLDKDDNDVAPNVAYAVQVFCGNIWGRYKDENPNSTLTYDFVKGDRVRFIANNDWTTYTPPTGPFAPTVSSDIDPFFAFNDTEILHFNAATGTFSLLMTDQVPQNIKYGVLYEIYTPAQTVINDNEIVYEIGEAYPLSLDANGNLIHEGSAENQLIEQMISCDDSGFPTYVATLNPSHSLLIGDKVKIVTSSYNIYGVVTAISGTTADIDSTGFSLTGVFDGSLSGTVTKAAEGVFTSGDCFRRLCDMPFLIPSFSSVCRLYTLLETSSASNNFVSNAWDYGRPNKIDVNSRQIIRQSTVYYSERLIPETTINGLSSVFDFNFQEYNADYGGIYKLWSKNQELVAYQERKIMGIGVLQAIFTDPSSGQRVVGSSTEVLNSQPFYYAGEFGIGKNPESHAFYGDEAWNIDVPRGVVIRLSNDGITPISDVYNMHNYFTGKCSAIIRSGQSPNIVGVYDVRFSEYILSFAEVIVGGMPPTIIPAETLAFNEDANVWTTFYSYIPESMCSSDVNIISWKDGALYTHNTNDTYMNFYGQQYSAKLWAYCNAMPYNQKVFKAISLESDAGWFTIIETPSGQSTLLFDTNFQYKEGFMYSDILMDDNTPNIVPSPIHLPNARFEGNPMRGQYALVKLEYDGADYNKIFAMNIMWVPSQRSNM